MNHIETLVAQFLKMGCTAEQADLLAQYFLKHPDELERYLGEEEWKQMPYNEMPAEITDAVWEKLVEHLPRQPLVSRKRSNQKLLVAAMILLLPLIGWLIHIHLNSARVGLTESRSTTVSVRNSGQQTMRVVLPDSSVVTLQPGAAIDYDSLSVSAQRLVVLTAGEAFFEVIANPERPFVVQTDALATVALGTKFSVSYNRMQQEVLVRLQSGKVVLRNRQDHVRMDEILLQPGQQCLFSQRSLKATVSQIKENKDAVEGSTTPNATTSPATKKEKPRTEWSFYKIPLDQVFDTVAKHHHITITFNRQLLHQLRFTGDLSVTDPFRVSLAVICAASGLSFEYLEKDHIVIKPKSE